MGLDNAPLFCVLTCEYFPLDLNIKREPHNHDGMLWIYGDSVSNTFTEYLVTGPYHKICETIFNECKVTYSWVYNVKNVESEENMDGKDYDHERVMREINEVSEYMVLLTRPSFSLCTIRDSGGNFGGVVERTCSPTFT